MPLRSALLAALVAVIWGVNFLAIELGLRDTPPLVLVALRFVLVAVPLVFFVPKPAVPWRTIIGVGLFMSAAQFGLLFTALHLGLPAGLASVVTQVQVVFTIAIAAVVLRERPTRRQILGAAIGIVGLAIVGLGRELGADSAALVPLLIGVGAGLAWAAGNIVARSARGASGFALVVWSALVVPIPMLALSLVLDGPAVVADAFATIGWETLVSLAYTVLLASLVGYSIWNSLLSRYPAAAVAPFALLVPPVGLASAALVLGERPNALELVGSAVLVVGVAITQLRFGRSRLDEVEPSRVSQQATTARGGGGGD